MSKAFIGFVAVAMALLAVVISPQSAHADAGPPCMVGRDNVWNPGGLPPACAACLQAHWFNNAVCTQPQPQGVKP